MQHREFLKLQLYKDKLIKFLELKNELIYKKIGINYVNKRDIREIKSWEDHECKWIYNIIKNGIFLGSKDAKGKTCPWCIKYNDCNNCGYGKRYGICIQFLDSYYEEHLRYLKISNIIYKDIIKEIEK